MIRMNSRVALTWLMTMAFAMVVQAEPPKKSGLETIELVQGQSDVLATTSRVETLVVSDPKIVDAHAVSSTEVILLGRQPGHTDVRLHLENGETIWKRVRVGLDEKLLEGQLEDLFGGDVVITEIEGVVSVTGLLESARNAEALSMFMNKTGLNWVNLTEIPGVQQVQLRVRIAEASREALRELSMSAVVGGSSAFGGVQVSPGTPASPVGINPGPTTSGGAGSSSSPVNDANFQFTEGSNLVSTATTLFGGIPSANLELFIQALNQNRYVRILAEPNLVAISGEEASFLVGGEFPIPIAQGLGGGSAISIEYKEFGVRLTFRPEVLGNDRIRLQVAPEVSELSEDGSVNLGGFTVPSVKTRRSQTTVELASGQTFALAGLLQSTNESTVTRVPVLGDLPILGPLFRSVRYKERQTELLVLVTAEFVAPLSDGESRPMPGDLHVAPSDWQLFMKGELHGTVPGQSPRARMTALGLGGLEGPGAWKRANDKRRVASDPLPVKQVAARGDAE